MKQKATHQQIVVVLKIKDMGEAIAYVRESLEKDKEYEKKRRKFPTSEDLKGMREEMIKLLESLPAQNKPEHQCYRIVEDNGGEVWGNSLDPYPIINAIMPIENVEKVQK